jgi:hypothetical protein
MSGIRVKNEGPIDRTVVLEPWGEVYTVATGHYIEFELKGEADDAIEVSFSGDQVKIWAPGGITASLLRDRA